MTPARAARANAWVSLSAFMGRFVPVMRALKASMKAAADGFGSAGSVSFRGITAGANSNFSFFFPSLAFFSFLSFFPFLSFLALFLSEFLSFLDFFFFFLLALASLLLSSSEDSSPSLLFGAATSPLFTSSTSKLALSLSLPLSMHSTSPSGCSATAGKSDPGDCCWGCCCCCRCCCCSCRCPAATVVVVCCCSSSSPVAGDCSGAVAACPAAASLLP
mmetsp:Transcript_130864/g.261065  ORF Transcript_130864/g.261065 Transcript_130864/m.261065 type:complete len:218 (-) Transcript_130864:490-1143(-)